MSICRNGYASLPGPLCHGVITKDGTVHLVGYGRTNHAGLGDDDVLRAVIAEKRLPPDNEANTDGNRHFYGFECENLGDGRDPWPQAQVEAIVRASAAILPAHGWGGDGDTSVIGHAEWQPGKVDPRGIAGGMPAIRRHVAERLKHPASWNPAQEDDMPTARDIADAVWNTDGVVGVPADWSPGNDHWMAKSIVVDISKRIRKVETTLQAQQATIRELAAALATHHQEVDADALVARITQAIENITVRLDVPDRP